MHDFVQFLTKNECLITEAKGGKNEIEVLDDKVRHLTVTFVPYGQRPLSISSHSRRNIRTLRASRLRISTVDSSFISQLKGLRTLNWSGNSIKELPEEIGDLIHLRHIDLCDNIGLEILPDSICNLYNSYTLRLKRCYALRKLPNNMKLISLKHLYVEGCAALDYLPKGLGRLTSLQTLDEFSGDNEKAFQFVDLRTLNLEGRLTVTFPGDVEGVSEVEKAQLWDKKQLFHLGLISRVEDNMQRKSTAADILLLHEDLESLYILGHIGTPWSNWMASLHNFRILALSAWDECELLAPLGKLPSLERLTLRRMERVKKVGAEFLGIQDQTSLKSSSSLFPKLRTELL